LRSLGVTGSIRSPTYTLIEPYELGFGTVYHLDLYRLADARELEMLALRDLLQPGSVLLVEWAEKGRRELPSPDLTLTLRYPKSGGSDSIRTVDLLSGTTTGKELAARVQISANEPHVSS
jgi:tRNA threonylcarbamoyladenosine biosynthesis protein TsaE